MSTSFLLAAVLALLFAVGHSTFGELLVLRRLRAADLPATVFGPGSTSVVLMRATWHMLGAAWLVMGAALIYCAIDPAEPSRVNIAWFIATSYTCSACIAIGSAVPHGPRTLVRHPAPLGFVLVATLVWAGILL